VQPERKILDPPDLLRAVASARAGGARIVFTNGCFDLLHAGHVDYLYAARAAGDLLIVGVNDDASVRRLKGPARPLVAAAERVRILAALEMVDFVSTFGEDTPQALIEAIQPDVLVKGADWATEDVVGRDVVEAGGGRVLRIPLRPGVSTTRLVERIRAGG
jgi:D-beta-D-heptose 7-phosphate kinase/D-beta-D-heptose 1-phosphate adenosyltransferase